MAAQALRAARARNGRGAAATGRPSGRMRNPEPLKYAPKVADSRSYAGKSVTGLRIGRGMNVTGDESGSSKQVTGSQYIGTETGITPREGGVKVGASRTSGGLVMTGTQVRSKVKITGDEANTSLRITGEADQTADDDLLERREQGAYASMQFERQNNPHGHTVFGTNLGRSVKSVGSRDRDRERALEKSIRGLPISGSAVGRSERVTGDEAGSCRSITGDQYLMSARQSPLCEGAMENRAAAFARADGRSPMDGRIDPVTGKKVSVSESWTRQRITGVDVEHKNSVTGDEYGVCSAITGTPYAGPAQYESFCDTDIVDETGRRVIPGKPAESRITGDIPLDSKGISGTHRGAERDVTGTPYYRNESDEAANMNSIEDINSRFSVRIPQRESQLRADTAAAEAPTAAGRITGAFATGDGKITGNREFHFSPRGKVERNQDKSRITGEGRVEGPAITGGAWGEQKNVTGTEGYIAAERNPSERAGQPHGFAGSTVFKSRRIQPEHPKQMVTGMAGLSGTTAARVTLSGGAHG